MVRHDNEGAEVNAIVLHRETKCRDNNRACLWMQKWSVWM
jgi:hypothetical protein